MNNYNSILYKELEINAVRYAKRFKHLNQVFNKGEETFEYFEKFINDPFEATTDDLCNLLECLGSENRIKIANAIDLVRERYMLVLEHKDKFNFESFEDMFGWNAEEMVDELLRYEHVVLISGYGLNYSMYFLQGLDPYKLEISPTHYHLTNIVTEKKVWGQIESCNMVKTGHSCSDPDFEIPLEMWTLLGKYCFISK